MELNKTKIINAYIDHVENTHLLPTRKELNKLGISNGSIWRTFGSMIDLHDFMKTVLSVVSELKSPQIEVDIPKNNDDQTKTDIFNTYLKFVELYKKIPNSTDLKNLGLSKDKIKYHMGNMNNLHVYMNENYKNDINNHIVTEDFIFNKEHRKNTLKHISSYNRFFITTYVNEKKVNVNFYNAIKNYCEKNNAKLLIIPCADVASTRVVNEWNFDPILKNESFVFADTKLNDNVYINTIKLSAKQINPITGLARIGQRNGSYIYASPKQFLEYVVSSSKKDKIPHAVMTTGAITVSDYESDKYMSDRTAHIADYDHIIGGIIVEIEDDRYFHFRQVQADKLGSFIDLSKCYYPDGNVEDVDSTLVLGDWHSGQTDKNVIDILPTMLEELNVTDIFVHDFFDGTSVNHHIQNIPLKLVNRVMKNETSLAKELYNCAKDLEWFTDIFNGNIHIIKGNHDEFLSRYLENGTYVKDPENHYLSLTLAKAYLDGLNPLKFGVDNITKFFKDFEKDRIFWYERDAEYKITSVELAQHGDLGLNGSRGSLQGAERAYGDCVIAHAHTPAILRGVYRVGTSTKLKLDYNRGPSSWVHAHCLVYENGTRQLVNIINKDYKLRTD